MSQVKLILALVVISALCGLLLFGWIRSKAKSRKANNEALSVIQKEKKADEEKAKIQEHYDEEKAGIISDPIHGGPDVMPVSIKAEHNHSFRKPCSKDCPAYTGD